MAAFPCRSPHLSGTASALCMDGRLGEASLPWGSPRARAPTSSHTFCQLSRRPRSIGVRGCPYLQPRLIDAGQRVGVHAADHRLAGGGIDREDVQTLALVHLGRQIVDSLGQAASRGRHEEALTFGLPELTVGGRLRLNPDDARTRDEPHPGGRRGATRQTKAQSCRKRPGTGSWSGFYHDQRAHSIRRFDGCKRAATGEQALVSPAAE